MKTIHPFLFSVLLAAAVCFPSGAQETDLPSGYPYLVLSNGILEASVLLADGDKGFYRSSRYDWAGMVWQLTFQGHAFFMGKNDTTPHDPGNPDHGISIAEEFDSTGRKRYPQRFDEAGPGETFLKIGVGSLEKPDNRRPYRFSTPYRIVDPGKRTERHGKNWIEFTHIMQDSYGFGYVYTKRIELKKGRPELILSHSLKNTGKKTIIADQYCHNFFQIDHDNAGKNYRVDLFFPARFERNLEPVAVLRDNSIIFEQDVSKALFTYMAGYGSDVSHNHAIIRNLRTGAGVDIRGDFPLRGFNFYAAVDAVCPEFFVDINVEPGKTQNWTRSYRFMVE
ncbi:MAG: hypothetical protein ACYC9O_17590 [Candidatus Latescibacterota bacterium]